MAKPRYRTFWRSLCGSALCRKRYRLAAGRCTIDLAVLLFWRQPGRSNRITPSAIQSNYNWGGTSMRLPVSTIILLFIAAALFSENLAAAAQSANPYPWCAIYYKEGGGTPRCYFDTRDQCMASISGIGGFS